MKAFTRDHKRLVKLTSAIRELGEAEFVVVVGPGGVQVRRFGENPKYTRRMTWRTVIGMALIHAKIEASEPSTERSSS